MSVIQKFYEGHCLDAYKYFGAHATKRSTVFRVYAPNASRIFVIGDFNEWEETHEMQRNKDNVFELEITGAKIGDCYRYRVYDMQNHCVDKSDPFAFESELRPNNASIISNIHFSSWKDEQWMKNRSNDIRNPLNIYEIHLGSWKKEGENFLNYRSIAKQLIPYLKEHGFTHVEIMPLNEHPFDGSWGYQPSGYFSVTSRYGKPEDFKYFVEQMHKNNLGVILDFVPIHFVKDTYGLSYFDGTPLYEYPNQEDAFSEWGTLNFNLWKEEVRSFLISAAAFFLDVYHIDGLRIDAVKNAIYWNGNKDRGENEGAIDFLKRLNFMMHEHFNHILMIAEDSSDYPYVCKSTYENGLGFDYKWDLGWMNDTLKYLSLDPIARQYHHNKLTFSMMYFYNEKFLLPLSHDEVVHGKCSIFDKMWGSYEQRFAQLKALYVYQFTHPGKKLNFMGNEFAHVREFDEAQEMDWLLHSFPVHQNFSRFFKKISTLYKEKDALHRYDFDGLGFKWIDADNAGQNLYSYERKSENSTIVVVINFSGNYYENQKIGVEFEGSYRELLNTDDLKYSGYGAVNPTFIKTLKEECNKLPYSIHIKIAPFSAVVLEKRHRRIKGGK